MTSSAKLTSPLTRNGAQKPAERKKTEAISQAVSASPAPGVVVAPASTQGEGWEDVPALPSPAWNAPPRLPAATERVPASGPKSAVGGSAPGGSSLFAAQAQQEEPPRPIPPESAAEQAPESGVTEEPAAAQAPQSELAAAAQAQAQAEARAEAAFAGVGQVAVSSDGSNQTNVAPGPSIPPTTTGEILNNVPSAANRRTSAVNVDTRLRGYNTGQINASADGATQYKTRIDIDSQLSAIDPGVIDPIRGITVIDGPYDSRYGLGYGFLVANLLETPRYDCGPMVDGSVLYQQATNGQGLYTRESIQGGGRDWGVIFSYGLRIGTDYFSGSNSKDFKVPASYNTWNTYFAAGLDLTRHSTLNVSYIHDERNDVELPGVVYDLNFQKDDQFNVFYVVKEDRDGPENLRLQYWATRTDYNGDSTRESKHRTFYDQFITANFYFNAVDPSLNVANTFVRGTLETQGLRALTTIGDAGGPQWTIGADWRYYQQYYTEEHFGVLGVQNTAAFGDEIFGIPTSTMNDFGILTHLVVPTADDRVIATMGGRLDWTKATVDVDEVNTPPADPGLQVRPSAGFDEPSEVLSMVYLSTDFQLVSYGGEDRAGFSVVPGVAYAMRNPLLAELYSEGVFVPLVRSGNAFATGQSGLTPERNFQIDLALAHRGAENAVLRTSRLRGFVSNIDNYILFYPVTIAGNRENTPFDSVAYQYANIERATLAGADFLGEIQLTRRLSMFGSMAYVKGVNHSPLIRDPNSPVENPVPIALSADALPGIAPYNGVLGLQFADSDVEDPAWGVSMLARMTMGQEYFARTLFDLPTPGWSTFDLFAYWRPWSNVRLTASAENLFNFLYTQQGSLAVVNELGGYSFVKEPGINFRFGVQVDF